MNMNMAREIAHLLRGLAVFLVQFLASMSGGSQPHVTSAPEVPTHTFLWLLQAPTYTCQTQIHIKINMSVALGFPSK